MQKTQAIFRLAQGSFRFTQRYTFPPRQIASFEKLHPKSLVELTKLRDGSQGNQPRVVRLPFDPS